MTRVQDTVRARQHQQTVVFQVVGRATMGHGLPVRHLAEQCLAGGAKAIQVDLRHCTYLDSTFLGTLLFLKRTMDRSVQGEFTLISPSPECRRLLHEMALEVLFPVIEAEELRESWQDLEAVPRDVQAFQKNAVQAHQELADLPGRAGEPFRWVVQQLNQEMEAKSTS